MTVISFIVPVYNAEEFLTECIESVLGQSYQNFELILVDDGSTDKSWEIINEYRHKFKNIIGIQKKNGGPNSARKRGMEIATGEFISFLDADDYIDESICEKFIQILESQDVDMVISCSQKIRNGKKEQLEKWKWGQGNYSGKYIAENMIDPNVFYSMNIAMGLWAKCFRKTIIENIFESIDLKIDFSEDYACLLLALIDSKNVFFLYEYLYYYRQNDNSLTHQHTKSNFDSQKYLYRFLMSELKKRQVSHIIYKQLEWMIIRDLLLGGYDAFKNKNYLYPFPKVKRGDSIIIYGAGVLGGELYTSTKRYNICNVALWVDQNWIEYRKNGFPVFSVEEIKNIDYDYIVIAILKDNISKIVKRDLEGMGIETEKIVLIEQKLISYKELPKSFWE